MDADQLIAGFRPNPKWATPVGSNGPCYFAAYTFSRYLLARGTPHMVVECDDWLRTADHPTDALGRPMAGPQHTVIVADLCVDWCWAWSGLGTTYPDVRPASELPRDWGRICALGTAADCDARIVESARRFDATLSALVAAQ